MSVSPLVNRIAALVTSDITSAGLPAIYPPTLEQIIIYALTELSTDSAMTATSQANIVTALAQAAGDDQP